MAWLDKKLKKLKKKVHKTFKKLGPGKYLIPGQTSLAINKKAAKVLKKKTGLSPIDVGSAFFTGGPIGVGVAVGAGAAQTELVKQQRRKLARAQRKRGDLGLIPYGTPEIQGSIELAAPASDFDRPLSYGFVPGGDESFAAPGGDAAALEAPGAAPFPLVPVLIGAGALVLVLLLVRR